VWMWTLQYNVCDGPDPWTLAASTPMCAKVNWHRKHNKPRPRVAHRGIARFLGSDQKCNQVVKWSLHTFPENFMQIGPAVFS